MGIVELGVVVGLLKLVGWLGERLGGSAETPGAGGAAARDDGDFVCADCGRTDLPSAGDWDPPICEECDAAINFDALQEVWDGEEREHD